MQTYFDKKKFVELCMSSKSFDQEALKKECEDNKRLFDHIMYEVEDVDEVADIPMDALLQMAEQVSFYLGESTSPWEDHLRKQIRCLEHMKAHRRMRVV